jgi:shikimate kinase
MNKKNIILIGMMGSGKTTVAKQLHKLLPDYRLVDLDHQIEIDHKQKISEIFDKNGEDYFRALEAIALKGVLENQNQIIASGGGIVLKDSNRELIKQKAFAVYLKTDLAVIFDRIKHSKNRPLLNTPHPQEVIKKLYSERSAFYESTSNLTIDTNHQAPEEIAQKIQNHLK